VGQFLLYVHLFLGCLVLCLLLVQCHSCFVGPSRCHRRRKNHTVAVAKITASQGSHVLLPVLASPPVPACQTQNTRAARMGRMLAVARAASADAARRSRAWLTERRLWEWNFWSRKFTWASIPGYMKLFGFLLLLLLTCGRVAAPHSLHMGPANWDFSAFVQASEVRTGWFAAQDHAVNATFTTAQATLFTLHLGQLGLNFSPFTVDGLPWASPPAPPAASRDPASVG
jgi:hypothetical protein